MFSNPAGEADTAIALQKAILRNFWVKHLQRGPPSGRQAASRLGCVARLAAEIFSAISLQKDELGVTDVIINSKMKDLYELRAKLEDLSLESMGLYHEYILYELQKAKERAQGYNASTLLFHNLLETQFLSISMFFIPRGQKLRLHDHPGMVVLSKVMAGNCKATVYSVLANNDTVADALQGSLDFFAVHESHEPNFDFVSNHSRVSLEGTVAGRVNNLHANQSGYCLSVNPHYSLPAFPPKSMRLTQSETLMRCCLGHKQQKRKEVFTYCTKLLQKVIPSTPAWPSTTTTVSKQPQTWMSALPSEEFPTTLLCLPDLGNIHEFEAVDCDYAVIFDICGPPYGASDLNECRWYLRDCLEDSILRPESFSDLRTNCSLSQLTGLASPEIQSPPSHSDFTRTSRRFQDPQDEEADSDYTNREVEQMEGVGADSDDDTGMSVTARLRDKEDIKAEHLVVIERFRIIEEAEETQLSNQLFVPLEQPSWFPRLC